MNIGFFTDTYQPGYSGIETSIDLFKPELEKQGHKVFIFAPLFDRRFNTKEENEKGIYRLQAMKQDFFPEFKMTFPISAKVFKNFGQFNLDIIHSHTPFIMGFYANFVGFTLNIPVVHTYHTFYEKYAGHSFIKKEKTEKLLMQFVKRITVLHSGRCESVIVPSEKMKKVLREYKVRNPITVLPTGVKVFNADVINHDNFRRKHQIPKEKIVLLFVGRLGKEKNISFLLNALKDILKVRDDVILVIIGEGPYQNQLKEEAEANGISKNVVFTGKKKKDEVFEAYAASNLLVFASLTDTQSLVLAEAASMGLPIVMLKDQGLTELVEDNINGYEAETRKDFVEKVLKIINDKSIQKRFANASKELVEQYSIEKQTVKLIAFYHETIKDYVKHSIRSRFKSKLKRDISFKKVFDIERNKNFFKKLSKKTKEMFTNLNKK